MPDTRDTREIHDTAGIGGYLAVAWPSTQPPVDEALPVEHRVPELNSEDLIDVERWEIEHIYRNWEGGVGGNFGAMTVRRVATGFKFAALIIPDFAHERVPQPPREKDKPKASVRNNPNKGQPFLEDKFEGDRTPSGELEDIAFRIAVKFQIGDPARLGPTKLGTFYYCDSVLVDSITMIDTSKTDPPDVVRAIVRGRGSAPLRRYVEDEWIGAGGFHIDGVTQGHVAAPEAD